MNPDLNGENQSDEEEILMNQDETDPGKTSRDDRFMGAGPTDLEENYELDVKDQMDHAMRTRAGTERSNPDYRPIESEDQPDPITEADTFHANSEKDTKRFAKSHKGGSTGAFTDLGAGRSGVTRH